MIKFEIIRSEQPMVIGDFTIPPGQRALKITLDGDDLIDYDIGDYGAADFTNGIFYIWGTKLAAFERMLRQSKREGNSNE